MDAQIEAYFLRRIEALEHVYVSKCLWFSQPAREILDVLLHHATHRQLERDGVFREANLLSATPMTFERVLEKLEKGHYPCECALMNDCRQVLMNVVDRDEVTMGMVRRLEVVMEELFVVKLNQSRPYAEVEARLAGAVARKQVPPAVQKICQDYGVSLEQQIQSVPQAALRALCKALPKVRRAGGGGIGPSVNVYASGVVGQSIMPMQSMAPQFRTTQLQPTMNFHQTPQPHMPTLRGLSPPPQSGYNDLYAEEPQRPSNNRGGMAQNAQNATFFEDVSPVHFD